MSFPPTHTACVQWEFFSDADSFILYFPKSASTTHKALLTGGVMLLNNLYFESDNQESKGGAPPVAMEMER